MAMTDNPSQASRYEQLRGVEPYMIDVAAANRREAGHVLDPGVVRTNPALGEHILKLAGQKLEEGRPSDGAYIDGFNDALDISKKPGPDLTISNEQAASWRGRLGMRTIKFLAAATGLAITNVAIKKSRIEV